MNDMLAGLIVACLMFVVSYLAALAVGLAVEKHIREREGADHLDERLRTGGSLYHRLGERCRQIMPQVARLDGSVKSMQRRTYMAAKRAGDLAARREQLIRVLGEEDAFARADRPARRYIAEVINRHIQRALLDQKPVAGLSSSWGRIQSVHVWAPNIGAAKNLVESYYPHSTGFHIVEIREPSAEDGYDEPLEEELAAGDAGPVDPLTGAPAQPHAMVARAHGD